MEARMLPKPCDTETSIVKCRVTVARIKSSSRK